MLHISTNSKVEYNWPTLCTELCYSFIWYAGSYMFRHPCAIFRELLMSSWVTWKQKRLCFLWYTVSVVGLCALTGCCGSMCYVVQLSVKVQRFSKLVQLFAPASQARFCLPSRQVRLRNIIVGILSVGVPNVLVSPTVTSYSISTLLA
jgi:hypothetical protein